MLSDNITAALKETSVLNVKKKADGTVVVNKAKVREWTKVDVDVDSTHPISADAFITEWVPKAAEGET